MPETCTRHGTPLDIDPIRGVVCYACDAELTPFRDLWRALWRWLRP